MIGVTTDELIIVKKIIRKLASDCTVVAFGSRQKGTHKPYSDLDLAFIQDDGQRLGLRKKADLKEQFMESDLPYRVDIIDYNGCSLEFKAIIDEQNKVVYRPEN